MILATHNCNDTYGKIPPVMGVFPTSANGTNWGSPYNPSHAGTGMYFLLPYIEQDNLYNKYNNNVPNQDPANQAFCQTYVDVYSCPSDLRQRQVYAPESIAPDAAANTTLPAGLHISTHAVGDRAIDWVVDSYAEALKATPTRGPISSASVWRFGKACTGGAPSKGGRSACCGRPSAAATRLRKQPPPFHARCGTHS